MLIRRVLVFLPLLAAAAAAQDIPNPLRLEDAIRIALANNPSYVASLSDVEVAEANRLTQWRTQYLPRPTLTLSTRGGSSQSSTPLQTTSAQTSSTSLGLNVAVPLLDNGTRGNQLRRATETVERAGIDHEVRERDLRTQVTTAYRNAQRSILAIAMQERLLAQSQRDVVLKNKQLGVAMASLTDIRSAELQVLRNQDDLEQARSLADLEKIQLLERMGIPGDRAVTVDTIVPRVADPAALNVDSLIAAARLRSPELETAELTLRSNEKEVGFQRSSWWRPRLSGGLSVGRNQSSSRGFDAALNPWPDNGSLNADITLQLPLPDYFQTRNSLQQANVSVSKQRLQVRAAEMALDNDVRTAVVNLRSAYSALARAEDRARLSQDRVRIANQQYNQGLLRTLELQGLIDAAAEADRLALNQRFVVLNAQMQLDNLVATPGR